MWFAEHGASRIGRITVGGVITEYDIPTPFALPVAIAAGPDGALWFAEQLGTAIGRIGTEAT